MVNISYLNFRRQWKNAFPQLQRKARKKKLHSSRDNNVQIGNFPIYDKIWIRDAEADEWWRNSLSVFIQGFVTGKLALPEC